MKKITHKWFLKSVFKIAIKSANLTHTNTNRVRVSLEIIKQIENKLAAEKNDMYVPLEFRNVKVTYVKVSIGPISIMQSKAMTELLTYGLKPALGLVQKC